MSDEATEPARRRRVPPVGRPETRDSDSMPDLVAAEGDVLVVTFPEMKISPPNSYSSITVGGSSLTRRLRAGESVGEAYDAAAQFLRERGEREARRQLASFLDELRAARGAK